MKAEEEARLDKDGRKEANEHDHAQLKVEEGVRLTLEVRRRAEDLGLKAEEARLKAEAEEQARLKAEEEAQIDEEARLK